MDETESLEGYMFNRHLRPREEAPPSDVASAAKAREDLGGRLPGVESRIITDDGISLGATLWDPSGRARDRVVVIASATGVLRGYYAEFASWLAAEGFAVVTFDYRGMGDSRGAASDPRMHEWGERDLASVVAWAGDALGVGQAAIIGHSVGGQLVGLLPDHARVRALVTIGSQSGDWRLWPLPSRLAMALLWYGLVPGVTHAVGYLPGALGVGEDLPAGVALEWARWCRTPGYLAGDDDGGARRRRFERLEAPVLAFGFDDDAYAPRAAVDALLALYTQARVERRHIGREQGRIGHFGFFRPRHRALWAEVAAFLLAH